MSVIGQNLVPNPSFECGIDQCEFTIPPSKSLFPLYVCNWELPSEGTTDVFSTKLDDHSCYSYMPNSTFNDAPKIIATGSQLPRSGNRFIGIFTYSARPHSLVPSFREYAEAELLSPLEQGETYCGEMFVSLAESNKYAANNMGMLFRQFKIGDDYWIGNGQYYLGPPIPETPQILDTTIILDSVNWVRVSGKFIAEEPYHYLIIGNFYDDLHTQSIDKGGRDMQYSYVYETAYYYVDDVSVERYVPNRTLTWQGNTTICSGDSTTFIATSKFNAYAWSTLHDTTTILSHVDSLIAKPTSTTQYLLKVWNCTDVMKDTITVNVNPIPSIKLDPDVTICEGETARLDAGDYTTFLWQDYSVGRYYDTQVQGVYSVTVFNEFNCKSSAGFTVHVKTVPVFDLGKDSLVCDNFYELRAPNGFPKYAWSTGATDSIFLPTSAGTYSLVIENECGISIDSVSVFSMKDIFIPNVITPNDDKWNRSFLLNSIGITSVQLTMFNRLGNEIYHNNHYRNEWPPENDSEPPVGTYYYIITYPGCPSRKGWVNVMR